MKSNIHALKNDQNTRRPLLVSLTLDVTDKTTFPCERGKTARLAIYPEAGGLRITTLVWPGYQSIDRKNVANKLLLKVVEARGAGCRA